MAREKLADDLARLATEYRALCPDTVDTASLDIACTRALVRGHDLHLTSRHSVDLTYRRVVYLADLHPGAIACELEGWASTLRVGRLGNDGMKGGVLSCLARLLPTDERSRFMAEAHGNLGACQRWWQRVDHVVCLALGTPRLAWMMRRDNHRGRP